VYGWLDPLLENVPDKKMPPDISTGLLSE